MKYSILISHEFYGSCYLSYSGDLVKDRSEAKTFDSYEAAKKECPALEVKYNCYCDVSAYN